MQHNYLDHKTDINWEEYWESLSFTCQFISNKGIVYGGSELSIPAGTKGVWNFQVHNSGSDLLENKLEFHLCMLNGSIAFKVQTEDEHKMNFVHMKSESSDKWNIDTQIKGFHNVLSISSKDGKMGKGESLNFEIGGKESNTDIYWTTTKCYIVMEAMIGEKTLPIGQAPICLNVISRNEVSLIRMLLPSCCIPGEKFRVCCGVFDSYGNINDSFRGEVTLLLNDEIEGLEKEIVFQEQDYGIKNFNNISFKSEGVYRIRIKYNDQEYLSNPCVVKAHHKCNIYWGDLHAHGYGDCTMHLMHVNTDKVNPYYRHKQGRDIGRFDFGAVGPMSFPMINREEIWDTYIKAAKEVQEEGVYIPFLSYEAHPDLTEDRVIIYKDLEEELPLPMLSNMKELMESVYKRDDVLIESHIGGATPKWELFRPFNEDLIEISSAFGNAEWLLHHAISFGYRPAVCGCSDLHMGLYGGPRAVEQSRGRFSAYLNQRDMGYGTGPLTAVLSNELTRDSLFQSIKDKSTYATTGERIYLMVEMNGKLPGSLIVDTSEFKLKIECAGTMKLSAIEVICGKRVVAKVTPNKMDYKGTLYFHSLPDNYLYLRVRQENESYAWSTPFYILDLYQHWDSRAIDNISEQQRAKSYQPQLEEYLEREENIKDYSQLEAIGMLKETVTECAVFTCVFKSKYPLLIKWYPNYEVPKIRFDWGESFCGVIDEESYRQI